MAWDSIRGQILDAIATRLKSMTVAGGYHYTVKPGSVVTDAVNLFNVAETELPFNLVEPSAKSDRQFYPAKQLQVWFRVLITARLMANGLDPNRKTQAAENYLADLEKCLTADITLGGLLFDLRLEEPDAPLAGMGNDNNVIVLQEVVCHFHRQYGVP